MSFQTPELKIVLRKLVDEVLPSTTDPSNPYYAPGVVFGVTNKKETVYLDSSGVTDLRTQKELKTDAVFSLYSTSKAVTVTGALILVDSGVLELDVPASKYLPFLSKVKVHKGRNDQGEIIWTDPRTPITLRHLMTHTAGFSYTIFSQEYLDYRTENGGFNVFDPEVDISEKCFLINEPGEKWHYGFNIDFVGKIIESVTHQSLGQFLQQSLFAPAKMDSFTFHVQPETELVTLHFLDGEDVKINGFEPARDPPVDLGGSGLFGKVEDYLKFIRLWLNKGKTEDGTRILSEEIVKLALENQLPHGIVSLSTFEPEISENFVVDKDHPDGWSLPFCINGKDSQTGRPKGSFHWAGISNLFYWIDYENGIGGFYASQLYPFLNPSVKNFAALETAVYDSLKKREVKNYSSYQNLFGCSDDHSIKCQAQFFGGEIYAIGMCPGFDV